MANNPGWWASLRRVDPNLIELDWQPNGLYNLVQQQSQEVLPDLGRRLTEYLLREEGHDPRDPTLVIKLMNLGTSANDPEPEPYVVVFVSRFYYVRTLQFFNKPIAGQLLHQPPRFKLLVYPLPPKTWHEPGEINVLVPIHRYLTNAPELSAYCGVPIAINYADKAYRMATCGGMIEVTSPNGETALYGLTVDHFIGDSAPSTQPPITPPPDGLVDDPDPDDPDYDEMPDPRHLANDGPDPSLDDMSRTTSAALEKELYIGPRNVCTLGEIKIRNCHSMENNPPIRMNYISPRLYYYDWSLVEICKDFDKVSPRAFSPNGWELLTSNRPLAPSPGSTGLQVDIMTCRGPKSGIMSLLPSQLLLHPGKLPIKTFIVRIPDGRRIPSRDSGSWVVTGSSERRFIIGYVVSVDVLGSVHVVPFEDVLNDIKMRQEAQSVEIHSVADFAQMRHYKREEK